MIKSNSEAVFMSQAVAVALLEFASNDDTSMHLCSVGIESDNLCATDVHTAVRFVDKINAPKGCERQCWSRECVEQAIANAKAAKGDVVLPWVKLTCVTFPQLSKVEPSQGRVDSEDPIGMKAAYLARFAIVAKACQRPRDASTREGKGVLPPAILETATGSLDNLRFSIGVRLANGVQYAHGAYVTIAPERY